MLDVSFVQPDWPLPPNVRALTTTRLGGASLAPYASFNLGMHVGDSVDRVHQNRKKLARQCGLEYDHLQWLNQVHGTEVCEAQTDAVVREADASYSKSSGSACVIMTADCLPVLFCDKQGRQVAAAHAGWRGLADGILETTLATFPNPSEVTAWFGPAIGSTAFEVGRDVVDIFCRVNEASLEAFSPIANSADKWLADLYLLARHRLLLAGVSEIHGGDRCTFTETDLFYSYRRDGQTGRMASVIWLT